MNKQSIKKKRKLTRLSYQLILMLCISLFLAVALTLGKWCLDNHRTKELKNEILDSIPVEEQKDDEKVESVNPPEDVANDYWDYIKTPLINVDFTELMKKNTDTVGWIKVNGTNINYPIVQTKDNDYYLTHAFDRSKNSAGWVFADFRNNWSNFDENTIIYGHGRLDNTVFGSLRNITKESWLQKKENHLVRLSTPTENTLWQVFSVYTIKAESYYLTTTFYTDKETHQQFLDTLKKRSIYDFSATLNTEDKIITLSTCQDNDDHRVVLHAKLIKRLQR